MRRWSLFNIAIGDNVTISQYSSAPKNHSESTIIADLSNDVDIKNTVYFGAPHDYLGNRLTSYGGFLKYSLLYTTSPLGNAISHADVILEGADNWLVHSGIEQPPINTHWKKNLSIVESEFTTISGLPATRELLMTALENLQGIYIRATYWEASITTRYLYIPIPIFVLVGGEEYIECYISFFFISCFFKKVSLHDLMTLSLIVMKFFFGYVCISQLPLLIVQIY